MRFAWSRGIPGYFRNQDSTCARFWWARTWSVENSTDRLSILDPSYGRALVEAKRHRRRSRHNDNKIVLSHYWRDLLSLSSFFFHLI